MLFIILNYFWTKIIDPIWTATLFPKLCSDDDIGDYDDHIRNSDDNDIGDHDDDNDIGDHDDDNGYYDIGNGINK